MQPIIHILLLSLFLTAHVKGQEPELTKKQIIERAWKARFGDKDATGIQTIYYESFFHGSEEPGRHYLKRPHFYRNESPKAILIFDGKKAAMIPVGEGGEKAGEPEWVDSIYWAHFEVDVALAFPAFFEYESEYLGIHSEGAGRTYELFVELPLGGSVTYFIDAETFLISRRLVSWEGDPEQGLWENLITGYRDYNGFLFEEGYSFIGRDGREAGYFRNVRYNLELDDALFRIRNE
jgi:hypothetical protein